MARLGAVDGLHALATIALASGGCNGHGSGDQCPSGVPFCDCAYDDGSYTNCDFDGGIPACPATIDPGVPCNPVGASCLSCPEGAGIFYYCTDAGTASDVGVQWESVGTGNVCKGP
jgi:hypothetical protein